MGKKEKKKSGIEVNAFAYLFTLRLTTCYDLSERERELKRSFNIVIIM